MNSFMKPQNEYQNQLIKGEQIRFFSLSINRLLIYLISNLERTFNRIVQYFLVKISLTERYHRISMIKVLAR